MKGKDKGKGESKKEEPVLEVQPVNRQEKLGYYLRKVEDKVASLIDSEAIRISAKKTPLPEPEKEETKGITLRLRRIKQSKERMESRLRQVSEQEQQLKCQQRLQDSRLRSQSPLQSKVRSELSEKDISLLKKLKKEQKNFQKSLEEKTRQYEQRVKAMKKQEEELREKHRKEQTAARKAEVAQKLEQLAQQRAEREKKYEQEKKKIIQLKTRKKVFEELEKRQKEADRSQIQNRVAAMEQRLKQREVDLQALRQHEQKYKELKAEQQQQRERRKGELEEMAKQKRLQVEKSKYYTLVLNENKRRKEEKQRKEKERLELVGAAREYAQNAMREHAPRVKTKEEEHEDQKVEKLSFEEQKQVGNSYFEFMRKIPKKKKDKETQADSSQHSITPKPLRTLSTKYRDYLSQRRNGTDKMSKTRDSRLRERTMMKEVEQACKLADSGEREEGLQRIRHLASRLEVGRGKQDHQMIDKINAKLKILQTLTK